MNRIKAVIDENGIIQKWLSDQLRLSPKMVNDYCQNVKQPSMKVLYRIADILNVDVRQLLKKRTVPKVNNWRTMVLYDELSGRELMVLNYLKMGMENREIAEKANIKISSVMTYRRNLFEKLGVNDRAVAVYIGMKLKIID